ncbi:leucine-rich repeat and IQ domain-containing protein 4 [Erethizon dorsatum]
MSEDTQKAEHLPKVHQQSDRPQVTDRTFFIDASNQSLTAIPPEILALKELEEVHLENNRIEEISQDIQHLRNIRIPYLDRNNLTGLCPELGMLGNLQGLDLSCNPLAPSSLPVLSGLRALRELRLYHLDLRELPVVLCKNLHHLELLGLSGNLLESLPKEIVNQLKLREIYLQQNQFKVFPQELCVLCNLEIIDLDENKLSALPEEIGDLTRLQKFYVARNHLPSLPMSLCQCSKMTVLDLSHNLLELTEIGLSGNPLESVPRLVCKWPLLHLLYLRDVGLRGLRRSFRQLLNLRFLDLSQNHLDLFPAQICALKNLEALTLDDNKIGQFPSALGSLSKLKILGLTGNEFLSFPEEIFSLVSLEKLYIGQDQGSKLTCVPEQIGKLQSLKELYIENNCLEYLPVSLGSMPKLEVLDCRHNLLKQLPDEICQAQGLRELLLEDNLLTCLPENLDSLEKLEVLTLMNNPMEVPPIEVCAEGNEAIWRYLKEVRNERIRATKIQAWWRGIMVRKTLGKFEELRKAKKKGKISPKDKKGKKDVKKKPGKGNKK